MQSSNHLQSNTHNARIGLSMPGKTTLLLLGLLLFTHVAANATGIPYSQILERYKKANQLFNLSNPTDKTDSMALLLFGQLIVQLEKAQIADTILFQSFLKKGVLLDVKKNYPEAKESYLRALGVKKLNKYWSDSLIYAVSIYVGSVYYHLNHFDSAHYYLSHAERLCERFPAVPEKERLFNVLGALYYENGNYTMSSNYFAKALEIVREQRKTDQVSALHFENNMAVSFFRLGQYQKSLTIYKKLIRQGIFTNHLYANMGKAYMGMKDHTAALACFRKVDLQEVPGVLNEMAATQLQLNNPDSAGYYLNCFSRLFLRDSTKQSSVDAGINQLVRGRLLNGQHQYGHALNAFQKAITIFSGSFNNIDIYSNPSRFTGTFTSYKLFEALLAKAATFRQWYQKQGNSAHLQASFSAYEATISLLRYIEKCYDTEDARLFLKKNSNEAFRNAFEVCLDLHRLHANKNFLEKAFLIAEQHKASVMVSQLTENNFKKMRGIDPLLLTQERHLKYNIARLNIKIDQLHDRAALEALVKEKMHFEIALSQLQNKIEQNTSYYRLKYDDSFPNVHQLQQDLHADQALISLYTTASRLYAFVITPSTFLYTTIDSLPALQQKVEAWLTTMRTATAGRRFNISTGQQIFKQLIQPIQLLAQRKAEWLVVPDDIFHFLPFESLPSPDGTPLLESTAISYQFSSRFIRAANPSIGKRSNYHVLSFAPFAGSSVPVAMGDSERMHRLPASLQEIAGLRGTQYIDTGATRQQFLDHLNQYPVIHLVTHAVAGSNNVQRPFLAFFPHSGIPEEDRLYADELYGLNMDATELVILSACETGNGKLISSEGVMSLSRGFAYAGCAGTVNSLWKADDMASAFILQRFHTYLQRGFSKSKALQRAKLDYIHSNTLNKSPGYWANLVLSGSTAPIIVDKPWPAWIMLAGSIGIAILLLLGWCYYYSPLNSRIFHSSPEMPSTFS